jgi:hypothetical protein
MKPIGKAALLLVFIGKLSKTFTFMTWVPLPPALAVFIIAAAERE